MQDIKSKPTAHDVLVAIRNGITSDGRWQPCQRLPTHRQFANELGAPVITVQRAIDRLRRDGFVVSKGKLGTFVADRPPHLSNFAVVFREQRSSLFYQAMRQVLAAGLGHSHRIQTYEDITSHADNEKYQQLVADIRAHRIGGLIFTASPHYLAMTPLLDQPGMPRVMVASASQDDVIPAVYPDRSDFLVKAVDFLARSGRRRPAMLMSGNLRTSPLDPKSQQFIQIFESLAKQSGMTVQPWWIQGLDATSPAWSMRLVQALFHNQQTTRPDALIIADDNLVEHAAAGLLATGVNVPRDVDVVAYANYPILPHSVVPVTRIGFDVRQIMLKCVELIVHQQSPDRQHITMATLVPAIFEIDYLKQQPHN